MSTTNHGSSRPLPPIGSNSGGPANKIKILCCTANMGNEEPDLKSLSEWIPKDGATNLVLKNQPYPIRGTMKQKLKFAVKSLVDVGPTASQTYNGNGSTKAASVGYQSSNKSSTVGSASEEDGEPVFPSSGGIHNSDPVADGEKFAIIAIGMQEATFDVDADDRPGLSILKNVKKVKNVVASENYHQPSEMNLSAGIKKINSLVQKPGQYVLKNYTTSDSEIDLSVSNKEVSQAGLATAENRGDEDTRLLHHVLKEHLPSYTRAVSYQRGQMRLMVFFNEDEISLKVLGVKAQNTGRAGLANKGGIVAELDINSGTRISFLSAHLEAHEGISKYNTRCSTIADILRGTESSAVDFDCDQSQSSHFMFFMGDLNFRTRIEGFEPGSSEHVEEAHRLTEAKNWNALNKYDELAHALRAKDCLVGFQTPECNFPPTFKVHRMDGYTYNEKRSPSYTDRILHKGNHLMTYKVQPLAYEPIDHFTTSDHKPVRGAYEVQLNPTLRWRPVLMKGGKTFRPTRSGRRIRGSKNEKPVAGDARCENLHLFLSSIECHITSEKYTTDGYIPSPFLSFVSTPGDVIKSDDTNRGKWTKLVCCRSTEREVNDGKTQIQQGWPRTKKIANTCNPEWQEEVHFKVRTHDAVGTPFDLTGALLHVLVFDSKDNYLIGSCALNLAFMIQVSRSQNRNVTAVSEVQSRPTRRKSLFMFDVASRMKAKLEETRTNMRAPSSPTSAVAKDDGDSNRKNQEDESIPKQQSNVADHRFSERIDENESTNDLGGNLESSLVERHHSNSGSRKQNLNASTSWDEYQASTEISMNAPSDALMSAFRASVFATSTRKVAQNALKRSVMSNATTMDSLNIHSIQIDEAITKNAREVGRIKFTIDTWWLDDEVAEAQAENRKMVPSAGHNARRRPGDRR